MRFSKRTASALALVLAVASARGDELRPRKPLGEHKEGVHCLAFSPDGKTLASGSYRFDEREHRREGEVRLWDLTAGKLRREFVGHTDPIQAIAFSRDGKVLATGGGDYSVKLWDTEGKELASFGPLTDTVNRVAFSPNGKRLAAAGSYEAWLWDVAGRKQLSSFRHHANGYPAAFSLDLKTLAAPCHQDMDLWDLSSGKLRLTLPDHHGRAGHAAFSPDGKTVAVAIGRAERPTRYVGEVKLWDAVTGKEGATFRGHGSHVWALQFTPDGRALALLTAQELHAAKELRIIDSTTGRLRARVPFSIKGDPSCLAFSRDGKVLAVGGWNGQLRLWDIVLSKGQ
jgi:WD40 repeat protein